MLFKWLHLFPHMSGKGYKRKFPIYRFLNFRRGRSNMMTTNTDRERVTAKLIAKNSRGRS